MKTNEPNIPAMDIKNILVPVDFSESSAKALRYAVALAGKNQAKITLLHVVYVHYMAGEFGPVDLPAIETQMKNSAQNKLEAFAREHIPAGVLAGMAIMNGPIVNEISVFARERKSDLIVVSTHGYTGLKHFMLGSVAENVVRHAPCPVLVVREKEHEFIHEPNN
jgi:universal stress protein A